MITQARLKEVLRYNSKTGEFFWIIPRGTMPAGARAGGLDTGDYWRIKIDRVRYLGHRLAWLYVYGYLPKELDHKFGNRSSCRISDLREATHAQNGANRKLAKSNLCGFKGVSRQLNGRWMARIQKGKPIHLGTFDTPEDAHAAYCAAAKKMHGAFFSSGA
jgi:AP2 domain/HNH endonuclease